MARFFLFIFLILLLSCSEKKSDLAFWIGGAPPEVEYWEKLVHEFEAQSGLKVRIVRQPTDSDQRRQGLVISLEAKQADPDVFLMDVVWIGQFALSGWLESLDTHVENSGFSTRPFFQKVLRLVDVYHDLLFALPVYVDGGLLYYRSDLLNKYGYAAPQTWDSLLQAAEFIQKAERKSNPNFNGFVWQGAQYEGLVCNFLEFISSNGGGIMENGRVDLDRRSNANALQFMQDLIHKYRISPENTFTEMKEEQVRRAFQRGNALFERNWPYAWKLHQAVDSPVRGKVEIAPLPHFPDGEAASALGGWHIGISKYSDAKEDAWKLVQYITSYQTQRKLVLKLGWNPGRADIYSDPEVLKQYPLLKNLRLIFEHAVARPNLPYYTQISEIIQQYANSCLAGDMEAAEALKRMQADITKITGYYEQK